jgi:hypothetical protein
LYKSIRRSQYQTSVGTTGDSYDNPLAESVSGLFKLEMIEYLKSDCTGLADVELATVIPPKNKIQYKYIKDKFF